MRFHDMFAVWKLYILDQSNNYGLRNVQLQQRYSFSQQDTTEFEEMDSGFWLNRKWEGFLNATQDYFGSSTSLWNQNPNAVESTGNSGRGIESLCIVERNSKSVLFMLIK